MNTGFNICRRLATAALLIIAVRGNILSQQNKMTGTGILTIATYNLRYANHGDSVNGNGWGQRLPVIAQLIRFHNFDIFGTQEGLFQQIENLRDSLPGYAYIGIGREDGVHAGEHSAIFYKTGMFDVLDKGNFWMSETTDKPNKGWDAALPRICSWGKFKMISNGFVFYLFNLHMDHVGVRARAESAKLVLSKIKALPAGTPVILTGDFNVDQLNESYALINNSGILKDSYEVTSIRYAQTGTFNSFKTDNKSDARIDHIFVSPQFTVQRYGILTDTYRLKQENGALGGSNAIARTPSDHFPVMVQVTFQTGDRPSAKKKH